MKTQRKPNHSPRRPGDASSARGQGPAHPISAPYNFVPLADWVFMPEWAPQVSHDVPIEGGVSGVLDITLTAHTPILCADEPVAANRNAGRPGEAHFIRSEGRYLIPGSTLKGMVRDAVEILSFGRMRAVDDRRFALRDVSSSNKIPYGEVLRDKVRAGFIEKTAEGPRLIPCQYVWLAHDALRDYLGLPPDAPLHTMFNKRDHKAVGAKIERWEALCAQAGRPPDSVRFDPQAEQYTANGKRLSRSIAKNLGSGSTEGVPVFTGQVSDDDLRPGTPPRFKKRDFVFFDPDEQKATALDKREWQDFLFTHGDEEERDAEAMSWPGYWRRRYFSGERVPVFYAQRRWGKAIGLAYMLRLAGDWSTHELIQAISPAHLQEPQDPGAAEYDLAELMFGALGACQEASLASRVTFEPAFAAGDVRPLDDRPVTVLNGPKPSYFPNYLTQKSPLQNYRTYVDLDGSGRPPTLRGRKRYPVRHEVEETPRRDANAAVCVKLHPLPKGTRFSGRVVFHNLRPEELGALIWGLTLGDPERYRHALGMGKPFGYGQLAVSIDKATIEPLDGSAPRELGDYGKAFAELMEAQCKRRQLASGWRLSDSIQLFMAMADPKLAEPSEHGGLKSGFPGKLEHMALQNKAFSRAKQDGQALQPYLAGIVLKETAKMQNLQPAKEKAAMSARVTPAPAAASPPKSQLFCADAVITYNPGQGTLEISGTVAGQAVRTRLTREQTAKIRDTHEQWWQRLVKKRQARADVELIQEGARVFRAIPESLKPR